MKTKCIIIYTFFLLSQNILGQEEYEYIHRNYEPINTNNSADLIRLENQHKLKIGNREITISTPNGQIQKEKHLQIARTVLAEDFLVNDDIIATSSSLQSQPTIAMDLLGNFVIVWKDKRNGNYDIYFQRYNSSGITQGLNIKVNDDVGIAVQEYPTVAIDSQSNFVIAWEDSRNADDDAGSDIYYQRYDSSGEALEINIKVNDNEIREQYHPKVAMSLQGNFVIAWEDGSYGKIYFQRYNSGGIPQGVNTIANESISYFKVFDPSIAIDSQGNFVISWQDYRYDAKGDIYYQRYSLNGTPQGINTMVNDYAWPTNDQWLPTISTDSQGNFVIAWMDTRNGNYDIYYQLYTSSGEAQGINTKANDDAGSTYQGYPTVAMNTQGSFVITWFDNRNENYDIYYQLFTSNGTLQGINTKANDDTGSFDQNYSTVALDSLGNFVITWFDNRNGSNDIYYQQFSSNGLAQGINTKANDDDGSADQSYPAVVMDSQGNFVVAWEDTRYDFKGDIYFQRYDSNGAALGINIKVNDDVGSAYQWLPTIAMDSLGNFVIAWEDVRDGSNYDIYYQLYTSSGVAQGLNTKVNDDAGSTYQGYPTLAMDLYGNFVIAWEDYRNGYNIFYQRYNSSGEAQGSNTRVNDGNGSHSSPSVAMDSQGNFVIAWQDGRNYEWYPDIYSQRYNSSGTALGINTKANDDAGIADQYDPKIALDSLGNFVITWFDNRNGSNDIYYQQFSSNGLAQGINTKANDDDGSAFKWLPSIAMDSQGNFVIAWQDFRLGKKNPDIVGQRYFSNGTANSSNYRIVADGPNHCEQNVVVCSSNSNIIFTWMDNRRSMGWDIYAKEVSWDWSGVSSVSEIDNSILTEYSLSQNYPNPFNPSTKISWKSPVGSWQTLKLYDILGIEIATLVDEYRNAGSYNEEFTINNLQLSSGIYFYQLRIGDFVETKKMILLK